MTEAAPDRDLLGRPPKRHPNWDHRRGEPRTFALVWTIFLMLATLVMFASMSAALVVTVDVYRPATRILLMTITAGIVLIWPMIRLSQARPYGSALPHVARDILIVLIPVQALIWPQALRLLGGWPLERCAAIAACQSAWALLIGGFLALGLTFDPVGRVGPARGAWMAFFAAIAIGVPLVELAFGSIVLPGAHDLSSVVAMMMSPITAVYELVRETESTGDLAARTTQWTVIGATSFAGAVVWVAAWCVERARHRVQA